MPRWMRILLIIGSALVLGALIVPLLWPVPPIRGTVEPQQLADRDSRFVEVGGITVHYREAGSAQAPVTIVLLHGFGASTFSWRDQLPLLGDRARVIAFDRPAFGLTERPLHGQWDKQNPYSLEQNAEQVVGLLDALNVDNAVLVGHSAGGTVAALTAARYPERVAGLVLEAPAALEADGAPDWLSPLLRTPQLRRVGPLLVRRIAGPSADEFIRSAYYDASLVTTEVLAGYRLPLKAREWDQALWEFTAAPRPEDVERELGRIEVPVLVVAGSRDEIVPFASSARVSESIPDATLVEFEQTGHIPHEERPERFANEVFRYLDVLGLDDCGS